MKVVRWIDIVLSCGKLVPLHNCAVCGERERDDDAIMKGGKAAMKLKIKQKKHLSVLRVGMNREYKAVIFWSGVDLQCEDVGE